LLLLLLILLEEILDLEDLAFGRLGVDIWVDVEEDVDNSLETWSTDLMLIIIGSFFFFLT